MLHYFKNNLTDSNNKKVFKLTQQANNKLNIIIE